MLADILILGGGPAGLSTALHLVQLAPHLHSRILLIEKEHYPRHKLCAGGLTQDAEVLLQGLGLDVSEIPHIDARRAHLDFEGRGLTIAPGTGYAMRIIRRNEFDAWLATKVRLAGIEIREGLAARRVVANPDMVVVQTDAGALEGSILVGADGSNGITRRSVLPHAAFHTARALEVLVPAESRTSPIVGPASTVLHAPESAYFDFAPVPSGIAGYTWDFPTQQNGNEMRCWGIYDTNLLAGRARPPLRQLLSDEMRRHGSSLDGADLQGHPIRWFAPLGALSIPRVILVGDAAGSDGIFGEGISIALGYGRIAAESIVDAIARNDFSFADYQRRILRSPLGQALTVRTAITQIVYRLHWRWFQAFFWRLFKPVVAVVSYLFVLNWARRMR